MTAVNDFGDERPAKRQKLQHSTVSGNMLIAHLTGMFQRSTLIDFLFSLNWSLFCRDPNVHQCILLLILVDQATSGQVEKKCRAGHCQGH